MVLGNIWSVRGKILVTTGKIGVADDGGEDLSNDCQ